MSYSRKQEEKRRLKNLAENINPGWPRPVYETSKPNKKPYYKKYWKSEGKNSSYAILKRIARKKARNHMKRTGIYTKKAYDLWWSYI